MRLSCTGGTSADVKALSPKDDLAIVPDKKFLSTNGLHIREMNAHYAVQCLRKAFLAVQEITSSKHEGCAVPVPAVQAKEKLPAPKGAFSRSCYNEVTYSSSTFTKWETRVGPPFEKTYSPCCETAVSLVSVCMRRRITHVFYLLPAI
jgi:hypothetical protein